jgi:gamma-glutamylcyclotransferase (GGCT)/AIG2-like uncharacterized protein YtfP
VTRAAPSFFFAYGSLKRGQSNHQELGAATFVDVVSTAPSFALRVHGGFPLLVPGSRSVRGELFLLSAQELEALDELEGDCYERRAIRLLDYRCAITYMARDPELGEAYAADAWPNE